MPLSKTPTHAANTETVEVRLTQETIDYLNEQIRVAVRDGIKSAVSKETAREFWSAGIEMAHEHAAQRTGRLVLGGLKALLIRSLMFLFLGSIFYAIGGWGMVARAWAFFFPTVN